MAKIQHAIRDAEGAVHQLRSALGNTLEKATMDQVQLPRAEDGEVWGWPGTWLGSAAMPLAAVVAQ